MSYAQTFVSARSYFFREALARYDLERAQYGGGRSLDAWTLEDFRLIHSEATSKAIDWRRSLRPWRPQ
jgi:hypothetical protein